jgi:hypothetical protein
VLHRTIIALGSPIGGFSGHWGEEERCNNLTSPPFEKADYPCVSPIPNRKLKSQACRMEAILDDHRNTHFLHGVTP